MATPGMKAKGTSEYSERLGALSEEQIRAALDRFDLGAAAHAERIPFGNCGKNVFVTSTIGELVLRGPRRYPSQFPEVRLSARLLHERTSVPVPWPYLLDPSEDNFGWSYVLMPRMPGLQLTDPLAWDQPSAGDGHGIAEAIRETLAGLHTLTWPCTGEYDQATDTLQRLNAGHGEWVVSRIRVVALTNRVCYGRDPKAITSFRPHLHDAIAESVKG
jgi:hygromycin-B 7''-O-kinase